MNCHVYIWFIRFQLGYLSKFFLIQTVVIADVLFMALDYIIINIWLSALNSVLMYLSSTSLLQLWYLTWKIIGCFSYVKLLNLNSDFGVVETKLIGCLLKMITYLYWTDILIIPLRAYLKHRCFEFDINFF